MQSVGDACAQLSKTGRPPKFTNSPPGKDTDHYFQQVHNETGYHQRLHLTQEYALANLSNSAYRVWDWIERTLQRQAYYHPEEEPVLKGVAISQLQAKLNHWAPEDKKISQRTVERAIQELRQKNFLLIEHKFRTLDDGARQQLPSHYRLRMPPALQVALRSRQAKPSLSNASKSSPKIRRNPTDKNGKNPETKLTDLKQEKTKKEKNGSPSKSAQTDEGPTETSTEQMAAKREAGLLQYWWKSQGHTLLEACALLEQARQLWRHNQEAPLASVLITQDGWKLLN
ncbi:hypothetical protein [Acidithiobacillus thiooxidans]|uniref:hypothetical protein n=1 Tax=Acidithiobacillus thiooxidans TaxID=930 RepID=UPI0004E0F394|nr:hypothetical protein [Acidithiobacillus thiooxidans]